MAAGRSSDRWVTPGVIMVVILVAGVLTAVVVAGVTYLTAMGRDPGPVVDLVAKIVTAVGSLGTLALQLFGRATVAKTERNTGVLAAHVADLATAPAAVPLPAAPVPPAPLVDDQPVDEDLVYEDLVDEDQTEQRRIPVPAIPAYPRHRRQAATQGNY